MNRKELLQRLDHDTEWDVCIIGGGATGLGAAVDAASRGLKTIVLEQSDLAKGTSSRSTKLVHGGVRYLQQGNIRLVMEALKERGLLLKNAPHLVHNQQFVVPNYKWWEGPFYGIGLKIYDWMAGRLGLGPSQFLSREETIALAPTLDPEGLRGGVIYHDGQFDDARLAISIAQTAVDKGAVIINYCGVTSLLKQQDKVIGVKAHDHINNRDLEIRSRCVVNATGVFADHVLNMDNPSHESIIAPSQGIHLVVDHSFLPGNTAILIPKTDDGRVLFAVPWHNKIVLGTTDTPVSDPQPEPVAKAEEIDFILTHAGRYLTKDPQPEDVKSVFAGLRPLVKAKGKRTAALSRDHLITVSETGLVSIIGGKWTTYRKMAEDLVDLLVKQFQLKASPCVTKELKLDGHDRKLMDPLSLLEEDINYAVQHELCLTVEDYLSRRTRHLLLDAASSIKAAPAVARVMAKQMGYGDQWINDQVLSYTNIASNYLLVKN